MQTIGQDTNEILRIIYTIVKDDPYPLTYAVRPRELILRSMQQWNAIHAALLTLEEEGAIETRQLDTLQISLTRHGYDLCKTSFGD